MCASKKRTVAISTLVGLLLLATVPVWHQHIPEIPKVALAVSTDLAHEGLSIQGDRPSEITPTSINEICLVCNTGRVSIDHSSSTVTIESLNTTSWRIEPGTADPSFSNAYLPHLSRAPPYFS